MYVDWEYYKIFYYVAKYQNFTRAARVLGNNQPNITHAMNRLESQLNCVLFIRSNRGVALTPEGELLYSRIASAAVQIQDAEEELSASATLEHGAISISTTETALNIYLSEICNTLNGCAADLIADTICCIVLKVHTVGKLLTLVAKTHK